LPVSYWSDAVVAATEARNICPSYSKSRDQQSPLISPFEAYYKRKPKVQNAHVFGGLCFVKRLKRERNKLLPSHNAIWLGSRDTGHLVEFLDERFNRTGQRALRRDIAFTERYAPPAGTKLPTALDFVAPSAVIAVPEAAPIQLAAHIPILQAAPIAPVVAIAAQHQAAPVAVIVQQQAPAAVQQQAPAAVQHEAAPQAPVAEEQQAPHVGPFAVQQQAAPVAAQLAPVAAPPALRRSDRSTFGHPYPFVSMSTHANNSNYYSPLSNDDERDVIYCYATDFSYEAADAEDPHLAEEWVKAKHRELQSLHDNETFRIVPKVEKNGFEHKTISHKWILKRKGDGTPKARVVARGFSQRPYYDFNPLQTASPVGPIFIFRLMFTFAAMFCLAVVSIDFTTAFLNSKLADEIYMTIPSGYFETYFPHLDKSLFCLQLMRSIYGLRQSSYLWYQNLSKAFATLGYQATMIPCFFFKQSIDGVALACWHVDDVLLICSKNIELNESSSIAALFKSSPPIRSPSSFLHWNIVYGDGTIKLTMRDYLMKLASQSSQPLINTSSPFPHPLAPRNNSDSADRLEYQTAVGQIAYAAYCGRPDVAYHASALSAYCQDPSVHHLAAAKRTLHYLMSTTDFGLTYSTKLNTSPHAALSSYSDSDWATDVMTRRSQSGTALYFADNLFDWSSNRQSIVATSTQEAELTAATAVVSNTMFVRDFLANIDLTQQTTPVWLDNKAGVDACLTLSQPKSKHISLRVFFLRDAIQKGIISVRHLSTDHQRADSLTKPLSGIKFIRQRELLGVS
jgi:hypothetical protein